MDGYTILIILTLFTGFIAVAWFGNAIFFRSSGAASFYWAASNAVLAVWVLIYCWRGVGPEIVTYQLADLLQLLSPLLLRRGTEAFTGQKIRNRFDVGIVVAAYAVILYARSIGPAGQALAVITASLFWSANLAMAARHVFQYMRRDFDVRASAVTVGPVLATAVVFFVRALTVVLSKDNSAIIQPNASVTFNVVFLLSSLACTMSFNTSLAGLVISRLIAKIRQLSIEDSLTGLANRRRIESLIEAEILRSHREQRSFSIVMLDVDHFKRVNDAHGHAAGDAALIVCANAIKNAVRGSDHVGRIGGEEFCALLPSTTAEGAQLTAERMRTALEAEILIWGGKRIPLTASFGVVTMRDQAETSAQLFCRADAAMYEAKNRGRNRVVMAA